MIVETDIQHVLECATKLNVNYFKIEWNYIDGLQYSQYHGNRYMNA